VPRTCHYKFYVLKALQLRVSLKDMYNSCVQVYGIYILNVNILLPDKLPGLSYITTIY